MDMSKIQRELGFIEGICAGLPEKAAELIEGAIVGIDCELESAAEIPCATLREPAGEDAAGKEIAADMPTTAEMDELVERLYRHHADYEAGYANDYRNVCRDCKRAAEVIDRLRLLIEDLEYSACMERP